MIDNMIRMAKIASKLSTCQKLQDIMFLALVKKYEHSNIVCSKYFYDIYLHMHKNGNVYVLDDAEINYLNSYNISNDIARLALKKFNDATDSPKTGYTFHDSFSALIYTYTNSKYKYLLVSIIADYSVESSLVHQCALIVDLQQGVFLFYEPYGMYKKYNASYISGMGEFLQQYKFPNKYYENGNLKYTTWHNYFGLDIGIQTILLNAHNSLQSQYENDKLQFLNKLKQTSKNHYDRLSGKLYKGATRPVHKDDKTFDTMEIAEYFGKTNVGNKSAEDGALKLYLDYNSKTCVTITLTEMDYFFGLHNMTNQEKSNNLKKYYSNFSEQKNYMLFSRLHEFIRSALNENVVNDMTKESMSQICAMLN
jgi:hypothetical protein